MSIDPLHPPGLGHSCASSFLSHPLAPGLQALSVRLKERAFGRHSHDTYTVVVTTEGVQEFFYRGGTFRSVPGEVVVLHPGEVHDGRPAGGSSFGYVGLHIGAALARQHLPGDLAGGSLPFVADPVLRCTALAKLLRIAVSVPGDELLVQQLLDGVMDLLCRNGASRPSSARSRHSARVERAEEFIRAHATRPIRLSQLEQACGLSASEVCRQFKHRYGASPHRYLLQRRVDLARERIRQGQRLADVAVAVGFTDQPHMNRAFRAFLGMSPGAYAALQAPSPTDRKLTIARA